uniref:Uncharacterized protein n=1 Tax=Knipowitschia caucasica TaxID=637954 RepID=A0AAV2KK00_KNICA
MYQRSHLSVEDPVMDGHEADHHSSAPECSRALTSGTRPLRRSEGQRLRACPARCCHGDGRRPARQRKTAFVPVPAHTLGRSHASITHLELL